MSDPSAYWLTLTNIALGLLVLVCCGAVVIGVVQEIRARRKKAAEMAEIDREVAALIASYDGHAFNIPTLGMTMADGGDEKRNEKEER